ncbi:unnamed protein product [Rotaria magnacalcarata]|uniref:Uncharacterized protein n=1 Tax=Rotaria magnacalcarata TaxID=392030 RepID=A0A819M8I2_9BILA|nr:unnamed protein product [Rotaria magnacalcarata]CAF1554820.1 unnamed protein product [Rotaria magnacalcarata]CAF2034783.1 unnamed protein product [Rotaria magnacalcarata]CAF2142503.1 unnamed protein product [Rotaria magnacalcarata]CAF3975844.1 unnamed protein product [Rotaria magnacalcarata]
MSRNSSASRSAADSNFIDTNYLIATVGPTLARGLAELVERRPADPIEHLAAFLYKQADVIHAKKQKEESAKRVEIKKPTDEQGKSYRSSFQNQTQDLREQEENKRKRHTEKLIKRHKELSTASPVSSSVHKDDEKFIVEFGETELHREAAIKNANLSQLLRSNYRLIASRNFRRKTPRDVARDAGLYENVDQIDTFCRGLLENGNIKAINYLLLYGYTELVYQLKTIENRNKNTFNFVNYQIPELLDRLEQFKEAIIRGNKNIVESIVHYHKKLPLYRDSDGSSSLHDAIKNRQLHIALYLIQKYPSLALVKDLHRRTGLDLLNLINKVSLTGEQYDVYNELKQTLIAAAVKNE